MTYDEALDYIHGVSNFFCRPGLDRIRELCERLGDPQKELKFIHVAGTNGKGSVCAMLDSILRAEGYRVGLFTSPYVREFNERMRINGDNIPNEYLASLTEEIKGPADQMEDSPTEFELITAIAFEYFRRERCDAVILEVGMGGRLDATNIIDSPLLSVITGISIDHKAFLGNTVEQIAKEKSGIIKKNSIALWGGEDSSAEAVISQKALDMQTVLCKTDYSKLKITDSNLSGTTFNYKNREQLKISLLGSYQPKNAALVLDAIDILSGTGIYVSEKAIRQGLAKASWPARFEVIANNPTVIFDGAHNPQGIDAAVESIKSYFGSKRVIILSGVLRDKDYLRIAESISEVAAEVYTITPDNPRALTAEEYAKIFSTLGVRATACESVKDALSLGISAALENGSALCCLGSLYTYGEIMLNLQID